MTKCCNSVNTFSSNTDIFTYLYTTKPNSQEAGKGIEKVREDSGTHGDRKTSSSHGGMKTVSAHGDI